MPLLSDGLSNENIRHVRVTTLLGYPNKTVLEVSFRDSRLIGD